MRRTTRYILYFMAGVLIYYAMEGDKNPDNLKEIHKAAPVVIIVIFGLLMFVKYIRSKKEK